MLQIATGSWCLASKQAAASSPPGFASGSLRCSLDRSHPKAGSLCVLDATLGRPNALACTGTACRLGPLARKGAQKHKKHTYQELLRARGCPLCRPPSSFDSSFAAKHGLHLPTCPLAALHSTAAWVPAMVCSARSFAALLSSMLFHGTVKVDGLLPTLACLSGVLVVFNCSVETAAREPCRPCSSRLWRAVKDGVGLITPVWVAVSAVGGGSGVRRMRLPGPMTLHCPFCELAASMLLPVFLLDRAACQGWSHASPRTMRPA